MREFSLGHRKVGAGHPCFIVAEMSANHGQDFETAVRIVKAAAAAGADAIKLQTYTPDTITIDSRKPWFMERSDDNPDDWKNMSLYELYQGAYTPWDWHPTLQDIARENGLVFFSSPFDATAVDFLEGLDVPCYKIASYEATDILLLRKVAQTGKPIIMSVGFATEAEIALSVETLRVNGAKDIALLHCVTAYASQPKPEDANLRTMLDLRERFDVVCGFSDNNGGIEIPTTAVAMGASIIEKHFILDAADKTLDTAFSLKQSEFKAMVDAIRRAETMMGKVNYGPQSATEAKNTRYRRSLFVVEDMKKGDVFTPENIRSIRPSNGLETKQYDAVIGKVATQDLERGTPLAWEHVRV